MQDITRDRMRAFEEQLEDGPLPGIRDLDSDPEELTLWPVIYDPKSKRRRVRVLADKSDEKNAPDAKANPFSKTREQILSDPMVVSLMHPETLPRSLKAETTYPPLCNHNSDEKQRELHAPSPGAQSRESTNATSSVRAAPTGSFGSLPFTSRLRSILNDDSPPRPPSPDASFNRRKPENETCISSHEQDNPPKKRPDEVNKGGLSTLRIPVSYDEAKAKPTRADQDAPMQGRLVFSSKRRKSTKSVGERLYCPVPYCNSTFSRKSDLDRHLEHASPHKNKEAPDTSTICRYCGEQLSRVDARKRHEDRRACGKRKSNTQKLLRAQSSGNFAYQKMKLN